MNFSLCSARLGSKFQCRYSLQSLKWSIVARASYWWRERRCFHACRRRLQIEGQPDGKGDVTEAKFWQDFKAAYSSPTPNIAFDRQIPLSRIDETVTAVGFLKKVTRLSENMYFAHVGIGSESIQILCRNLPEQNEQLKCLRVNSAVAVTGVLGIKHAPKNSKIDASEETPWEGFALLNQVEIRLQKLQCLNDFAADIHLDPGWDESFNYPPDSRHLQIRFDNKLRERLKFRSDAIAFAREQLEDFQEVETPILFKSTSEGAREFLVPTRKKGFAYALPQSPQQYKQILMASGIQRYFQFARCFRDEDLRTDRQPEFTQIDLEMAWTDGEGVMQRVEKLVKALYEKLARPGTPLVSPLSSSAFLRMSYEEAMSKYGSDKPDLRIKGLIHRIHEFIPTELRKMITPIEKPIIEASKLRLNTPPRDAAQFVKQFMDSPDAEPFKSNKSGAPGFAIFDSRRPLQGLQSFGHEAAEKLKSFYEKTETELEDGDIVVIQAREDLPHSGGSTSLGKLRLALHKAAVEQGYVEPDQSHHYLWITDFPMFTLDNGTDPGQGGNAGFSATHHPFTAPKSSKDVDLLLTDPLKATADHYDLVVNGIELGGGSRRIHSAPMQVYVLRNIIKMDETRLDEFSHLIDALGAGCPPHAGFAIGFDRMVAVMTGRVSVKDVIAFPKSSKGEDMMVRSPSKVSSQQLSPYGLTLRPKI